MVLMPGGAGPWPAHRRRAWTWAPVRCERWSPKVYTGEGPHWAVVVPLLRRRQWPSLAYPQISYHVNRACGFMSNPWHGSLNLTD